MSGRCPTCASTDIYRASAAREMLEERGQLDDWTAAWLGDADAKQRLLDAGHDDAVAIEPRAWYCETCFSTFDEPRPR